MGKTTRMTTAQAIVKFLDNQYISMDGEETKFVEGFFTIFGHGKSELWSYLPLVGDWDGQLICMHLLFR